MTDMTKGKKKDRELERPADEPVVEPDAAALTAEEPATDPIAALEAKVAELEDKLLRSRAELKNVQRRAALDRSEALRFGNAELMRSLLGVMDDLERSLAAAREVSDVGSLVEGVQLIYDNMMKALRDHGLEDIVARSQPFDPNYHEAILQQPTSDHPAGTVVDEVARGYKLHERVLRPAKVVVAKDAEANGSQSGG